MDPYPSNRRIDLADYGAQLTSPEVFYGLPAEVAYCKRCGISNQRPNTTMEYKHTKETKKETIRFDSKGVCDACAVNLQKREIVWKQREREFHDLCDKFRRTDGRYDSLVPGSGGKDSFKQAHLLKHKYNMHPLTTTWAPHTYTEWGWKNFQAWMMCGFDNHLITPNGLVHRLLTRIALEEMYNPFQPFIIGQKSLSMKMALQYDIPLIFYGDHAAEWGTPKKEFERPNISWDYYLHNDPSQVHLSGISVDKLKEHFGLTNNDLLPYMPVNAEAFLESGIEMHYMAYYEHWHPQANYYYAVEHGRFQPSPVRTAGTYSKYSSMDDMMDDFHHYTGFIKFGTGRAMTDACQEARNEDITREEAIALIRRYDGEFPERFERENFEYLSIPEDAFPIAHQMFETKTVDRAYFDRLTDSFRSPHLWKFENDAWAFRNPIWQEPA